MFTRIGFFTVMEILFIFLAAYAMFTPIVLPFFPSALTEAKAIVTSLSVIWHTIAVSLIRDVPLHIFSAEWMEQVRQSGRIALDETDIVSRITTGYLDHIRHWISPVATRPFRLGFISILLLLAVNPLGPSAITVSSILRPHDTEIHIAQLTLSRNRYTVFGGVVNFGGGLVTAVARANLITRLEMIENSTYGFTVQQPNILIPWPSSDLASANNTIKYETDVITYNYSCSWQRPTLIEGHGNLMWTLNNETYILYGGPGNPVEAQDLRLCDPMILPLLTAGNSSLSDPTDNPLTVFLFVGQNMTLRPNWYYQWLNLDNIPNTSSTYSLPNHTIPERPPDTVIPVGSRYQDCSPDVPFVFTALMCNPQFEIRPATVSLYRGSLSAQLHSAGLPTVGNISPSAANFIFANSLGDALSFPSDNGGTRPNDIARNIFLSYPESHETMDTLPIHIINQNMNVVLLSSSKALLSGYSGERGNTSFPDFEMITTEAVGEVEVLLLSGSKPFPFSLTALVGTLSLLTASIALVIRHGNQLRPFDIRHIIETLGVLSRE
ncbi:hypothetical protein AN958_11673 [Leucoagaricus sp. SymC.cos]|nr:hypothetical protein AN958_11673 [Leucoagaricus sp. SymC.cos]